MFFKIEMNIETDPEECKNCKLERKISEAYANALNNDLFQTKRGKRNAVYCSDGSPWKTIFDSMQFFENDEMSLTARLDRLEEKEKNFTVYMRKMKRNIATDVVLPVQREVSQIMDQPHNSSLPCMDDSSNICADQENREDCAKE